MDEAPANISNLYFSKNPGIFKQYMYNISLKAQKWMLTARPWTGCGAKPQRKIWTLQLLIINFKTLLCYYIIRPSRHLDFKWYIYHVKYTRSKDFLFLCPSQWNVDC